MDLKDKSYLWQKTIELLGPSTNETAAWLENNPVDSNNYNDPDAIEWAMQMFWQGDDAFAWYDMDVWAKINKTFNYPGGEEWDKRYKEYIDWAFSPKLDEECWQKSALCIGDTSDKRFACMGLNFKHDFTKDDPNEIPQGYIDLSKRTTPLKTLDEIFAEALDKTKE